MKLQHLAEKFRAALRNHTQKVAANRLGMTTDDGCTDGEFHRGVEPEFLGE